LKNVRRLLEHEEHIRGENLGNLKGLILHLLLGWICESVKFDWKERFGECDNGVKIDSNGNGEGRKKVPAEFTWFCHYESTEENGSKFQMWIVYVVFPRFSILSNISLLLITQFFFLFTIILKDNISMD